ncbi:MAG: homoserine O-succinyltransferase [Planctomycetota bacterium]
MPLVAHSRLPVFDVLRTRGADVRSESDPSLPSLRIGLFNLMPDAVLQTTERQFMQRVAGYADANVWVFPFTEAADSRDRLAREHIAQHYHLFRRLMQDKLDAVIITGANPRTAHITGEEFWEPMVAVIRQVRAAESFLFCSCLATHAFMKSEFAQERVPLPRKRWGVFSHEVAVPSHPLLKDITAPCFGPHSHLFETPIEQLEEQHIRVLIDSDAAGFYLAASDDCRLVFAQGHPEYDPASLLKEFKREVNRFMAGEREDFPPSPEGYFNPTGEALAQKLRTAMTSGEPVEFPEEALLATVHDTWSEPGAQLFENWLGLILSQSR